MFHLLLFFNLLSSEQILLKSLHLLKRNGLKCISLVPQGASNNNFFVGSGFRCMGDFRGGEA